ncbi:MAG TPA: hypothetical protein VHV55_21345 [Pirellulales bacterium]|nr:hypothetical protein [Pirellulales bacterium]
MAFKFLDTHDVVEALQQQENTSRQRFQYLCDQLHEVLRRLHQPEAATDESTTPATATADSPPAVQIPVDELQRTTDHGPRTIAPPVETIPPSEPAAPTRDFDPTDWGPVVLGPQLAGNPALAAGCRALLAGLVEGDARAMKLAGQLLLFRSAPAERYPQLLKDLGEAYYGWRAAGSDDGPFEAALVAWLSETCAAGGVANSIERVQPGDRFDPTRHQAPQPGVEVAEVHGWVVLRDNGKVYTRAAVTAR